MSQKTTNPHHQPAQTSAVCRQRQRGMQQRGRLAAWHCGFIPTRGDSGRRSNCTTSPPGPLDLPSRSRLRAAALPSPPEVCAMPIFARRQCLEAAPPPATLSGLVAVAPRRMLWSGRRDGESPTTRTKPQRGARRASPSWRGEPPAPLQPPLAPAPACWAAYTPGSMSSMASELDIAASLWVSGLSPEQSGRGELQV